MTRFFGILFTLALYTITVQAQKQDYFKAYGNITAADLSINTCSYEPNADAIVIFNVGKSSFERVDNGFDVIFKSLTRIKILNEAGIRHAQVEIPYYRQGEIYEQISNIKARTYTVENGIVTGISELDLKTCYDEDLKENWKVKKFALPNVKTGSIIEYTYDLRSQYHFNFRDWEFQWDIPVLYSEYEARLIPFYEYSWLVQGTQKLDVYENYEDKGQLPRQFSNIEYRDMVYRFALKNIPSFKDEEYITSKSDYILKIDFQLSGVTYPDGTKQNIMTTWPELIKDYLKQEDFGKYISKSEKLAQKMIVADSLLGKSTINIAKYIVRSTKEKFTWNGYNRQFANLSPSDLIKEKTGNSADINLWMIGALRAAGIEAYPVILSTRSHGKILSDYPFSSAFNYVVACAYVDDKAIWLDATDLYCPFTKIPIHCMNDKGLIVDKEKMAWLDLKYNKMSIKNYIITIDSIDSHQKVTILTTATDYEAIDLRNKYATNLPRLKDHLKDKLYEIDESSVTVRNATDTEKPFIYNFSFKTSTEKINDKLYISPFFAEVITSNPFKQKTRTYPIDFTFPFRTTYIATISIPAGYKVDYLPENMILDDELFNLEYTVTQSEGVLNIFFSYSAKQALYGSDKYSRVKAHYNRVVTKGNEKIVFSRK